MNFTRSFFASVLGTLTAFGLLFVILLLIISATASIFNASTGVKTLSDNSILNLDLNLPIVERPPVFDEIQSLLGLEEEVLGLPNILSAIKIAAENPKIQGIRLRSDFISSGFLFSWEGVSLFALPPNRSLYRNFKTSTATRTIRAVAPPIIPIPTALSVASLHPSVLK